MSLSVSLGIAQSGLSVTADQTAVVSRNVANANNAKAWRRYADVVTASGGGIRVAAIRRITSEALFRNVLTTTSSASGQKAMLEALDRLDQTINDPELDASPAALVAKLSSALQQYAEAPNNTVLARTAVSAALDLTVGLNSASGTVQQVRQQADDDMAHSVERLNTLLSQFQALNIAVVDGTRAGADVTDQLDARDAILTSIAEEVGVRAVPRADGDMALYTDSGVTLFDVKPRTVAFTRTTAFAAGVTGSAVYVDGVPITGSSSMPAASGRLVGLVRIRDDIAVTYQSQLDEIARGLIEAFAESDQSAVPILPDVPGLFTWPGAPAIPPSGAIVDCLASSIRVHPNVDPAQGGDPNRLRDGGISGNPAYIYNSSGAAAFSDRIHELVEELGQARTFDPTAQASSTAMTLSAYASSSVSWLEEVRRTASSEQEYRDTLLERASEALSKITGVNLDEEMTNLLELERSYQASSKLLTTIDAMFDTLLAAVG